PTAGTKRLNFSPDGTGAVILGDDAKSPVARFALPTGRTTALKLLSAAGAGVPGSTPSTTKVLYGMSHHNDASTATNASGATVAAWVEWDEVGEAGYHARLRAAFGRTGEAFGTPVTLQDARPPAPYASSVSVAIADDGRAAIVADDLSAKAERPDIVAWAGRSTDDLGTPLVAAPGGDAGNLDVMITSAGSTVIAWEPPQRGEDPHPPTPIRAVSLGAGANAFSPVQLMDPGTDIGYPRGFGLAAGPGGTALLAWNGTPKRGGGEPLLVARTDAAGAFSSDRQQVTTGETLGGLATRSDGAAVITTGSGDRSPSAPAGSAYTLLPRARAFGARETVPTAEPDLGPLPVAFDPKTGRPAVAYVIPGTKTRKPRLVVVVRDDRGPGCPIRAAPSEVGRAETRGTRGTWTCAERPSRAAYGRRGMPKPRSARRARSAIDRGRGRTPS
ncbi:MAG: hypothetical protein Q7T55_08805, partial [Solirubrobacteraceae bacterium]|nr:hypothetical protein [Solirubrobacteraceae bacterium]